MNELFQKHFEDKGFKTQSLIQERVSEPLRSGVDVVGLSPTGSGKTLAFGWPLLEKIIPKNGPQLLVLAPSQELAIQTTDVLREWASLIGLTVTSVTGGANVQRQIERLKKKPEVIVGTPGRVLTLINERRLKVNEIQSLVMDEADELLTGEALQDVRQIEDQIPTDAQLSFFSATNDLDLSDLKDWFDVEPEVIDVRALDQTQGPVEHGYIEVSDNQKARILKKLSRVKKFQGLVFFNHVSSLEKTAALLKHEGVSVGKIAGHQVQIDRASAMRRFKKKELALLLVTDVAARGLDIEHLPAVVNFDVPKTVTTYTHRVGRTGRMGESGQVLTLGNDHDIRNLRKITKELNFELQKMTIFNRTLLNEKTANVQKAEKEKNEKQAVVSKTVQKEFSKTSKPVSGSKKVKETSQNEVAKSSKKSKRKHSKRKGMRKPKPQK